MGDGRVRGIDPMFRGEPEIAEGPLSVIRFGGRVLEAVIKKKTKNKKMWVVRACSHLSTLVCTSLCVTLSLCGYARTIYILEGAVGLFT